MTLFARHLWLYAVIGTLACASLAAGAQSAADVPVLPRYGVEQFAQAAAVDNTLHAQSFALAAAQLQSALGGYCDGASTRSRASKSVQTEWRATVSAWDQLAALAVGPLVERRSARAIDFMPARPDTLARAVAAAPRGEAAMERIGAPAKGFDALELLLWPDPPRAGSPACDYALEVAAFMARESVSLAEGFAKETDAMQDDERAGLRFSQLLNQWVGGIEQLRWAFMRKPVEAAASRKQAPQYPRRISQQTRAMWRDRWSTLQAYAVQGTRPLPAANQAGAVIAFETWLRSRGLSPLADKLASATQRADRAMQAARPQSTPSVLAASAALGEITKLVQTDIALALGVSLGFSDADGD